MLMIMKRNIAAIVMNISVCCMGILSSVPYCKFLIGSPPVTPLPPFINMIQYCDLQVYASAFEQLSLSSYQHSSGFDLNLLLYKLARIVEAPFYTS
jgi:hypothetical protein